MNQVKKTVIGFLMGIGIYTIIIEMVGIFFSEDVSAYTWGVLLGTVVAISLIFHMTRTLDKALDLPQEQATKYTRRQSLLRLLVMLIAMIIALQLEQINFIALLLGLLGLKIGALLAPPILKRLYPEEFVTKLDE